MISLQLKNSLKFPVTAKCISPDALQDKSLEEIEKLKIWVGNKKKELRELFKIEIRGSEREVIHVYGDLTKVRGIGAEMTMGELTIHGNTGMHLGEEMKGGKIIVYGNTGDWTGSMMKNGTIEIYGNTGNYLGAPYRGLDKGMSGGKIIVHGNVKNEAGAYMQNGIIKVYGSAGQFAGLRMKDGTIYIQKKCGERVGANMRGGKIIVQGFLKSVLPTFTIEDLRDKVKIENEEIIKEPFYLFLGDLAEDGKGKLYISKKKNPHLNFYEKFLEGEKIE